MRKVHILCHRPPWKRGFNHYFPILKWKKELRSSNYSIFFKTNHRDSHILDCDILIVDARYYEQINKGYFAPKGFTSKSLDYIKKLLHNAESRGVKKVLFDSSDSALFLVPELVSYYDVILKKQIFKKAEIYTCFEEQIKMYSWRPSLNYSEEYIQRASLPKETISKIRVGWNIGLCDYRKFPQFVHKYLPLGTSSILPRYYRHIEQLHPQINKRVLVSYRGGLKGTPKYDSHRIKLLEKLFSLSNKNGVAFGSKIPLKHYLRELRNSKAIISPFGYGEICYRDFETLINGSLLIKPSMDHLLTYPDIYEPGKTYIATKWDFSDIENIIDDVRNHYNDYLPIIKTAQSQFDYYYNSFTSFVQQFSQIY
ncbi:MAG: hypothetical protein RIC19_09790 [Phaeodactylibacter sp.]|uniref:hypothetical protein n=1 Tax=Phaeodactylibacter sp. TaxID=1940289 RepID=UPI0032ED9058